MKASYDPKCEELARYMLNDTGEGDDEARVAELAGEIRQVIEDYLEDETGGST